MTIEEAIKEYQCSGCVNGSDLDCGRYEKSNGCGGHAVGTMASGIGYIFLGLFKGFNRLGICEKMTLSIFETQEQQVKEYEYDWLNIPVWKYRNEQGHIFIRGLSPRINYPFLHIILNGDFNSINCFEVTEELLATID